jgi:hypothetical protein
VPLDGTDVPVEFNVSVEPTICTGNKALADPAVAVIVAVRLALLAEPEEKVVLAFPVASVVNVELANSPVSAFKVILVSGTVALFASTAVTVIVVFVELSDLIVEGVPEIWMPATVDAVGVAAVPVPAVLSLHPASSATEATSRNNIGDFRL